MIDITPHPEWVEDLLDFLQPYEDRVVNHKFFEDVKSGRLTKSLARGALINFYPLIESFPKYMALSLAKVQAGGGEWSEKTRDWLSSNIKLERLHVVWWKRLGRGFGIPPEEFTGEIYPPLGMDAINNYLWRICSYGSLAEAISASNYAIEGPTGEWTKRVSKALWNYQGVGGLEINEKTLEWVSAHAEYDDKHPYEALEIIKILASTEEERKKVRRAAKRALEYYALALDTCYELFK